MSRPVARKLAVGIWLIAVGAVIFGALILPACQKEAQYPNVILISVDTLRADRLGCYGYKSGITGMMDFWAEKGVRFAKAYAPSPWTLPSHASVFTGLYPTEHRAIDEKINIDSEAPMLTEALKQAGFTTAAFVSHIYLGPEYGFDRGFDDFVLKPNATADVMVSKAKKWLKKHRKENFFLFLHLFDPHTPYQPPPDYAKKHYPSDLGVYVSGTTKDVMDVIHQWPSEEAQKMRRGLSALYDGEIDFVDNQLEVLFKFMQENMLDQNTLVILFSDHGEEFMEHGLMEHGFTLYEEQLLVPWIMYFPGQMPAETVLDEPVNLIDLLPTLLDFLGLPAEKKPISGKSLMPLIRGEVETLGRSLLAETTRQGPDRVTIIKDREKYMYSPPFALNGRSFGEYLFNLQSDPGEEHDLFGEQRKLAEKLKGELFSGGLYVQRRAWHMRWGKSNGKTPLQASISAAGNFIYVYKQNTIYGTNRRGLLESREYALDKSDPRRLRFGTLCQRANGVSFMTDPETADVSFHLMIDGRERPERIWLGDPSRHPGSGNFTLKEPVELTPGTEPPAGGVLIWSEPLWVNFKQILRAEVGDPIQLSPEVRKQLRELGYISGD